ncbi:hypothetical protein DK308_15715, partial [Listeria monocytogenes]
IRRGRIDPGRHLVGGRGVFHGELAQKVLVRVQQSTAQHRVLFTVLRVQERLLDNGADRREDGRGHRQGTVRPDHRGVRGGLEPG